MRSSGKVLKEFENLRKALFDNEISHVVFMRDGKCEILYTKKYVDKLETKLQQKENIIKEVREYATQHMTKLAKRKGINGEENGAIYVAVSDLLEILDKEKQNENI